MSTTHLFKRGVEYATTFRDGNEPAKPVIPIVDSSLFVILLSIGIVYFTLVSLFHPIHLAHRSHRSRLKLNPDTNGVCQ